MEKVVVGMSGGVDSFVTALLLKQRGYDVTGVTLDLWEKTDAPELETLCENLNIKLIHWDGRELFRRAVVTPFTEGYLAGHTPSPCCLCNHSVKWRLLLDAADALGVERIATGHYVRIAGINGCRYIRKGVDEHKDQSYFLWGLRQEILVRAMTPLGDFTKTEVKAYAVANGYENLARKKESMGVCFLRGTDYRAFIRSRSVGVGAVASDGREGAVPGPEEEPGLILNRKGEIIGRHTGIPDYTIGQKRGMPLADGQPLYVAEINAATNTITADVKTGLYVTSVEVEQVKTVCRADLSAPDVEMKIRGIGLNPRGYISVTELSPARLLVHLSSPAWAVAPGQPVAFYRGELLVGGGIAR